jgi:hypothetical protein
MVVLFPLLSYIFTPAGDNNLGVIEIMKYSSMVRAFDFRKCYMRIIRSLTLILLYSQHYTWYMYIYILHTSIVVPIKDLCSELYIFRTFIRNSENNQYLHRCFIIRVDAHKI